MPIALAHCWLVWQSTEAGSKVQAADAVADAADADG